MGLRFNLQGKMTHCVLAWQMHPEQGQVYSRAATARLGCLGVHDQKMRGEHLDVLASSSFSVT